MKYLITRADDFGSAQAANQAIIQAVREGNYVKNVSCMAVGPHIEKDAAELEQLHREKGFCIGLHATINSEWEPIHFKSILSEKEIPSLVDKQGVFTMHPMQFEQKMPRVEESIKEISAQLEKLTVLGLTVEYMDTHMLAEAAVPGLMEELSEFAKKKGLVDQRGYYTFPSIHQPILSGRQSFIEDGSAYQEWYECFEEGKQYIHILHPAKYGEETRKFYNKILTGDGVAKSRGAENILLNSGLLEEYCEKMGIRLITYKEAKYQGDTTMDAFKHF